MISELLQTFSTVWWDWLLACLPGALIIYLAAELVLRLGKNWPARLRYAILLLLLVKCVVPAPWTVELPFAAAEKPDLSQYLVPGIDQLIDQGVKEKTVQAPVVDSNAVVAEEPGFVFPPLSQVLFVINIIGALLVFGMVLSRVFKLHWRLWGAPQDESIKQLCAPICVRMGLRVPRIYIMPQVSGPVTGGLFFPYILIPAGLLEKPQDYQTSVLAHELAHIKRRDSLVNYVQIIITSLFWWNPIVARVNHLIRCEREHCCDDMVIRLMQIAPQDYSNVLLDAAEEQVRRHGYGWGLAFAYPRHAIYQRIRRMVMEQKQRKRLWIVSTAVTGIFAFSIVCGFQIAKAKSQQDQLLELMQGLQQMQLVIMKAYSEGLDLSEEDMKNEIELFAKSARRLNDVLHGMTDEKKQAIGLKEEKKLGLDNLRAELLELYRLGKTDEFELKKRELFEKQKDYYNWDANIEYQPRWITDEVMSAGIARAESETRALKNALECFFIDHKTYPIPIEGNRLDQAGIKIGEGANAKILRLTTPVAYLTKIPVDPFDPEGKPYRYFSNGVSYYALASHGPDLKATFDVSLWKGKGKTDVRPYLYLKENGARSSGDIINSGP